MTEIIDEEKTIEIDDNFIREYSSNTEVIRFVKKRFKRLSRPNLIKLIKLILRNNIKIHITEISKKWKGFYQYNKSKFDKELNLLPDEIKSLRRELNGFLVEIGKDLVQYDTEQESPFVTKLIDGEEFYLLDKATLYEKVRTLTCDEGGDVNFRYNFDKPDMDIIIPGNCDTLQRCQIQILGSAVKFDYPIENKYACPKCQNIILKKAYETASTHGKVQCDGIYNFIGPDGESKSKICNTTLVPDNEVSLTKDAYYYDVGYEDETGSKNPAGTISFQKYEPGYYEVVMFKIKNPRKTELYQIIDIKPIESNKFKFPEPKEDINYLITLQEAFDKFIKKQTGMEIYALKPIKVALIIQKLFKVLKMPLVSNIQIVGNAATGKSTVFKYWGFLLNNHKNLSTNGLSVSVPALRGTKQVISLMGKDQKIITTGYLGTFDSIHIDEAGENRDLVQNLKTFLCEENYGYDRAGGLGIFHKRTAQINISENLDYTHLGIYRGAIKKAYKDQNYVLQEEGDELSKPDWDEDWDLHKPLIEYNDNIYLYEKIKEHRTKLKLSLVFWIDGYDYALHERFPLYFYLVNEKKDEKLKQVVKGNVARNTIRENLELIRALKSDDINAFFLTLVQFKDSEKDTEAFEEVDKILEHYKVDLDSRITSYFYNLIKVSRIINKRLVYTEEDYKIIKWFIEKINCKLDVINTINYDIHGPPEEDNNLENRVLSIKKPTTEIGFSSEVDDDFNSYKKTAFN